VKQWNLLKNFYVELFIKMNSLPLSLTLMKNDLLHVVEHNSKASKQVLRLQRSKMKLRVGGENALRLLKGMALMICYYVNFQILMTKIWFGR
jgi:hypothetical protein